MLRTMLSLFGLPRTGATVFPTLCLATYLSVSGVRFVPVPLFVLLLLLFLLLHFGFVVSLRVRFGVVLLASPIQLVSSGLLHVLLESLLCGLRIALLVPLPIALAVVLLFRV